MLTDKHVRWGSCLFLIILLSIISIFIISIGKNGKIIGSVLLGFSGLLKNLEMVQAFYGTSLLFATTITYPDGSTEVGDFFLDTINNSGASTEGVTYDASCHSSGVVVFTAGT